MKPKILVVLLGMIAALPLAAQKPEGKYSDHKQRIKDDYRREMRAIASRHDLSEEQKKQQRDLAASKYLTEKRANRIAYRRKVSDSGNVFGPNKGRNKPPLRR